MLKNGNQMFPYVSNIFLNLLMKRW